METTSYWLMLRPSSHSSDHAIICTYENRQVACMVEKALKQLVKEIAGHPENFDFNWIIEDVEIKRRGNAVTFVINTDLRPSLAEKMMAHACPLDMKNYENFQEFTVHVTAPVELTINEAALILSPEEARLMHWLNSECGMPKIVKRGKKQTFKWIYRGETIYEEGDKIFRLGEDVSIKHLKHWQILM